MSAETPAKAMATPLGYAAASPPLLTPQRQPEPPAAPPLRAVAARCLVCSHSWAGPLGICLDCAALIYPHGMSPWAVRTVESSRRRP